MSKEWNAPITFQVSLGSGLTATDPRAAVDALGWDEIDGDRQCAMAVLVKASLLALIVHLDEWLPPEVTLSPAGFSVLMNWENAQLDETIVQLMGLDDLDRRRRVNDLLELVNFT